MIAAMSLPLSARSHCVTVVGNTRAALVCVLWDVPTLQRFVALVKRNVAAVEEVVVAEERARSTSWGVFKSVKSGISKVQPMSRPFPVTMTCAYIRVVLLAGYRRGCL